MIKLRGDFSTIKVRNMDKLQEVICGCKDQMCWGDQEGGAILHKQARICIEVAVSRHSVGDVVLPI